MRIIFWLYGLGCCGVRFKYQNDNLLYGQEWDGNFRELFRLTRAFSRGIELIIIPDKTKYIQGVVAQLCFGTNSVVSGYSVFFFWGQFSRVLLVYTVGGLQQVCDHGLVL